MSSKLQSQHRKGTTTTTVIKVIFLREVDGIFILSGLIHIEKCALYNEVKRKTVAAVKGNGQR